MPEDYNAWVTPRLNQSLRPEVRKNLTDFLAQYYNDIQQYRNTPYYEQLLNNPYLSFGNEYSPSQWEESVTQGIFGDFSRMKNFYSERNTAAREEMYKILGSARQDEYNSPAQQAARQDAAGLNSDLLGVSGEPAAGSPGADETSSPSSPSAEQLGDSFVAQAMQGGLDFFQNILSFGSMIQGFQGASLDNMLKDIQVTGNAYNQVLEMIAGELPFEISSENPEDIPGFRKDSSMDDTLADALLGASHKRSIYSNRRVQQLIKEMRGRIQYTPDGKPTLAYQRFRTKLIADLLNSRKDSAGVLSTPGYDDNIIKFGQSIAETFTKVSTELWKKQTEFQQKYWNSVNPELQAAAENAKWTYDGQYFGYKGEDGSMIGEQIAANDWRAAHSAELQKELDTIIDEGFKDLARKCKAGDKWYHTIGLFLIPIARGFLTRLAGAQFSGRSAASASNVDSMNNGQSVYRSDRDSFFNFGF